MYSYPRVLQELAEQIFNLFCKFLTIFLTEPQENTTRLKEF